jgi:single-strand DNA-binding protein
MSSINSVILVGRLGRDPELKHTQGGHAFTRLGLATSEGWTDDEGQRQEKTEWHQVMVWKKPAEYVAKYGKKGSLLFVRGHLETHSWEDQAGVKRYQTDIVAEKLKLIDWQREESPGADARPRGGKPVNIQGEFGSADNGEIPF